MVALVGTSVTGQRLVGCLDEIGEMPDETAGNASVGDAVVEHRATAPPLNGARRPHPQPTACSRCVRYPGWPLLAG